MWSARGVVIRMHSSACSQRQECSHQHVVSQGCSHQDALISMWSDRGVVIRMHSSACSQRQGCSHQRKQGYGGIVVMHIGIMCIGIIIIIMGVISHHEW